MEAPFRGFQLGKYAGGVVGAEFLVADAAGPGAHGVGCCFEGDGFEACRIVGAYGGSDDVEEGAAWGADAEGALCADKGGAEVEGVAFFTGSLRSVSVGFLYHGHE